MQPKTIGRAVNARTIIIALVVLAVIALVPLLYINRPKQTLPPVIFKPPNTQAGETINEKPVVKSNIDHSQLHKDQRKRIVIVLGTRPEAIKCAPLISHLKKAHAKNFNVIVLSTGQHREILKQTLGAFGQDVDIDLNVMTFNQQLGKLFSVIFDGITEQIQQLKPDLLVVQGDTTTSLAAALAAQYQRIHVAHVEAGLRSFDLTNPYPEELNRKVIDGFASLMFAPTDFAKEALIREGACEDHVHVTGNTGIDAFFALVDKKLPDPEPEIMTAINGFKKKHAANKNAFVVLVTMHRRENIEYMAELCHAVNTITEKHGENIWVVLPVHPNPNVRKIVFEKLKSNKQVHIVEPISYDIFPHVQTASDIIMTDSGGIQEEGASIGKPVILMRKTTERPEGVYMGSIQQVGVEHDAIVSAVEKALSQVRSENKGTQHLHLFGDGKASERIGKIFEDFFSGKAVSSGKCAVKKRQDDIAAVVYKDGAKATLPAIGN